MYGIIGVGSFYCHCVDWLAHHRIVRWWAFPFGSGFCVDVDDGLCGAAFECDGAGACLFQGDVPCAVAVVGGGGQACFGHGGGDVTGGTVRCGGHVDFHRVVGFAGDGGWCGGESGDGVFGCFDGAGGFVIVGWRVEVKFAHDDCAFGAGGHRAGEGDYEWVAEADFEFASCADECLWDTEVLCAGVAVADVVDDDVAWRVGDAFVAAESDLAGFAGGAGDDAFEFRVVVEFREQHAEEADRRADDVKFEAHFVVAAVWDFDGAGLAGDFGGAWGHGDGADFVLDVVRWDDHVVDVDGFLSDEWIGCHFFPFRVACLFWCGVLCRFYFTVLSGRVCSRFGSGCF